MTPQSNNAYAYLFSSGIRKLTSSVYFVDEYALHLSYSITLY